MSESNSLTDPADHVGNCAACSTTAGAAPHSAPAGRTGGRSPVGGRRKIFLSLIPRKSLQSEATYGALAIANWIARALAERRPVAQGEESVLVVQRDPAFPLPAKGKRRLQEHLRQNQHVLLSEVRTASWNAKGACGTGTP